MPTPLEPARVQRTPVHLRRISVQGFEREDGLLDIEGTLIDTKPFSIAMAEKTAQAGDAIHHMVVRLAVDGTLTIVEAESRTVTAPYGVCGDIARRYAQLVGLQIGPGFTKTVKRMFRGVMGCSHMTELLPPMATTAYQIAWSRPGAFGAPGEGQTPLGGCHALRLDGAVVLRHFPHAVPKPKENAP